MKYLLTLLCLCCLFTVARAQETSTDNEEPRIRTFLPTHYLPMWA